METIDYIDDQKNIFFREKHISFVLKYLNDVPDQDIVSKNYVRLAVVYWCITILECVQHPHDEFKEKIVGYVQRCQCKKTGGFYQYLGDNLSSLKYTMYAIQILAIYDSISRIDEDAVATYIKNLQQTDGSFYGAEWIDEGIHNSYYAVNVLSLLNQLNRIDVDLANDFVLNFTQNEIHFISGDDTCYQNIYSCIGYLSILKELKSLNSIKMACMLCEKLIEYNSDEIVRNQYSTPFIRWQHIMSLKILGRAYLLKPKKLRNYFYKCQDTDIGGLAKQPNEIPDIISTYYGITALSLWSGKPDLIKINPSFLVPEHVVSRLNIYAQVYKTPI